MSGLHDIAGQLTDFFAGKIKDVTEVKSSAKIPRLNNAQVYVRKWTLADILKNQELVSQWKKRNKELFVGFNEDGDDEPTEFKAFKMGAVAAIGLSYEDGSPLIPKPNCDQVTQMIEAVGGYLIDRIYYDVLVVNGLVDPNLIEKKIGKPESPVDIAKKN